MKRSLVAPSDHSALRTEYGIRPGAGLLGSVMSMQPVALSSIGTAASVIATAQPPAMPPPVPALPAAPAPPAPPEPAAAATPPVPPGMPALPDDVPPLFPPP